MLCKITLSDRHCLKTEHTGLDLTVISTLPPNASSQQIFRLDAEIQNKDARLDVSEPASVLQTSSIILLTGHEGYTHL